MTLGPNHLSHIIIVGGGAGGIELASLLGKTLGKPKLALITLVDSSPTHIWKPLLHEVAAGTMNTHEDEVNYMAFASSHFFKFSQGTLQGVNRSKKEIILSPLLDKQNHTLIPERTLSYDILIVAVGSVANDFGIGGVREYCYFLDNHYQANAFHAQLINQLTQSAHLSKTNPQPFNIAIVGGGATGIELIAELHSAVRMIADYGLDINPEQITFSLIEAANTLLPALPERASNIILKEMQRLKINVFLNEQVCEVTAEGLKTKTGKFIPAQLKVWTAGIKAPDFLKDMDGLEVNRANQLVVKQTLQTTLDPTLFSFGDCASCPQEGDNKFVPPRAQAAHQQAVFLAKSLKCYLNKKPLPIYHFHDHGSLVTLSHYKIVGELMGKLTKSFMVEGKLARFFYLSLYKLHQVSLFGYWRVFVLTIANFLSRRVKPRLKLH